jgi:acetoin utilization protein AcuC
LHRTALVWDDALAEYRFTPEHPLDPHRLQLTIGLIDALRLIDGTTQRVVPARSATIEELAAAHAREYISAVQHAADGTSSASSLQRFGLGTADVPIVAGMHEAAAHICGATLRAAELVMSGEYTRAFNIAGGLHHARHAEASGFCIYNDLAVAIRWLQREHSARVMYIDIDAHHGDGVQWIFYEDPDVLTLSFHESGAFLYPGTGFIDEHGEGEGFGYSMNVPFDPHTDDVSFLHAVKSLVPDAARAFGPDVIVLQAGCDAHVLDPLTHLRCTTTLYEEAMRCISDVADDLCNGRIIATGGGGYAIHTVVPRAWTLVWAALCGIDAPDDIPSEWRARVGAETSQRIPDKLRDRADDFPRTQHSIDAELTNARTLDAVRRQSLPLLTGWGLGF